MLRFSSRRAVFFGRRNTRPLSATLFAICAISASSALFNGDALAAQPASEATQAQPAPRDLKTSPERAAHHERVLAIRAIGREMFLDPRLSASGKQACASCHDPKNHFSPSNDLSVQLGGGKLNEAGTRNVPSLTYIHQVPMFVEHFHDSEEEGDDSLDAGPTGGLTWDGRVNRGSEQARIPLFNPAEMANTDPADLIARISKAPYADKIRGLYGAKVFDNTTTAMNAVLQIFEFYEQTPEEFFPYTSKYDAFRLGRAKLSAQEEKGLRLFIAEDKGNCASCHRFSLPATLPVFNDYGLIALGVPRNPAIPATHDKSYYDLGLCGPYRTDYKHHPEYCGLFRSPSLRNVATRKSFFHNGVYHSLKEVLNFYVLRDVQPEKIYPRRADGSIDQYNDLPKQYRENLNMDPPFGGKPGDAPALSPDEIDDVIAFLNTLTDGYKPESDPTQAAADDKTAVAAKQASAVAH
ncbi:Methylamine utilization protein MauG precursor [Bordetella ansorpii]|uniref:Methylamine utilization protein MauG n=1 Tax=Bordetella ansorpii TaxID=288768 RepID=A0A157L0J1_9BORD|nr:cytochrome c peroxidase [Bordetella ansorpii]SAH90174.1 Methylamine utilization protein MauG precursor [Bordetella ansorpii]